MDKDELELYELLTQEELEEYFDSLKEEIKQEEKKENRHHGNNFVSSR